MSRAPQDPHDELSARIREAAQDVHAPDALRLRVQATREAADAGRRRRAGHSRGGRTWQVLAAGAAVAAVALIVVLTLAPSTAPAPTVDAAATLALRAPAAPAPATAADDGRYIDASVGPIRFPSNAYTSDSTPSGIREGRIDGRRAVAVSYGEGADRVGYTVVDRPALAVPRDARQVRAGDIAAATYTHDGATVVTWQRDGHTCVVASRTVPLPRLLRYVGSET